MLCAPSPHPVLYCCYTPILIWPSLAKYLHICVSLSPDNDTQIWRYCAYDYKETSSM